MTSKKDKRHNCVAWAAERDRKQWWEPLKEPGCYWPKGVPFDHSFQNYVKVFEVLRYSVCKTLDVSLEVGVEKVVLFKDAYGHFTHVSHQLEDGKWSSKLGPDEDIKHDVVEALEAQGVREAYGSVATVMKRSREIWEQSRQKPRLFSRLLMFFRARSETS